MRPTIQHVLTCFSLILAVGFGCRKSDEPKEATAPANAEQPADRPTTAAPPSDYGDETDVAPRPADRPFLMPGKNLELEGLALTVPEGWKAQEIQPGPFAAVAAFTLPRAEGDPADGSVRITHYPNMKGMDDMNIDRWLSQVTREDGSPYTREEAKYVVREVGNIRLKIVDMTGSVQATMAETPQPNSRMIATIVDHPEGPHFVIVTGRMATMNQWEGSVSAFLRSATVK